MKRSFKLGFVFSVCLFVFSGVQTAYASTYESTMGTLFFMEEEQKRTEAVIEPSFRYMFPQSNLLAQWGANRKEGFNVIVTVLELRARTKIEACERLLKIMNCGLYIGTFLPTHWDNPERFRYDAVFNVQFWNKIGLEIGRQGNWNIGTGNIPGMSFWNSAVYYNFNSDADGLIPAGRIFARYYMNTLQAATLTPEFGLSLTNKDTLKYEVGAQLVWHPYKDIVDVYAMPTTFIGTGGIQKVGGSGAIQFYPGRVFEFFKERKLTHLFFEVNSQYFTDVSGMPMSNGMSEFGGSFRIGLHY